MTNSPKHLPPSHAAFCLFVFNTLNNYVLVILDLIGKA